MFLSVNYVFFNFQTPFFAIESFFRNKRTIQEEKYFRKKRTFKPISSVAVKRTIQGSRVLQQKGQYKDHWSCSKKDNTRRFLCYHSFELKGQIFLWTPTINKQSKWKFLSVPLFLPNAHSSNMPCWRKLGCHKYSSLK